MKKKFLSLSCCLLVLFSLVFITACTKTEFIVNFMVDSQVYATINTNGKEVIKMPENPTKEGYSFEGWYWDKDIWKTEFTARSLIDTPLSSNMEIYAHFVDESYLFGTNINIKDAIKMSIEGVGDVFYLTQRNNQLVCKLEDYVECNPKTTWILSTDISGNNPINSKTIELQLGDNPLYYIYVTDKNGQHDTYIVLIHRNYMFNVSFNTNGGTSCESKQVEEGYKLDNVPSSSKKGYEFDGWDYDFNDPIKENVIANANWIANQYKISFNVNGGNALSSNELNVTYDRSFTLPNPTRKGYRFDGWYNGSTRIRDGKWNYTENMTLTAHWDIIIYDITYNLDGGNANLISLQNTYTVEDEIKLQSPSKLGYDFDGWSTSQSGKGTINYAINKGTTGNLTFYAKWKAKEYTINYDVNGGKSLTNSAQKVIYGNNYSLVTPTRLGYKFDGWYKGNEKFNNGTWSLNENVSLVAHWTLETYTITYYLDGGDTSYTYPATYTVNDLGKDSIDSAIQNNLPTKTGYTLGGLYNDANYLKPYTSFSTQTTVGNKDVYFKWNPNKYIITFNVNSGNALESNTMDIYYDSIINLPTPIKDGYLFQGWFSDSEKFTETTWTRLDDLSLTAKWTIETYRITYELDGGSNNVDNPSVFNYEDETIVLSDPSKVGYTFIGWTVNDTDEPVKNYEIKHNSTSNITIIANWQANKYIVTFDANGGSGLTVNNTEVEFDSNIELPILSKTGYVFVGWYEDTTKYDSGIWKVADNITITAKFEIINYEVVYELDGGANDSQNPATYTYISEDIILNDPSKAGYTFLGWTSLEISTPTKNVVIANNSQGKKTFTANWKVNTYTITYDADGGDALTSNVQKVVYGDAYSLVVPTRPGYTFEGWFNNDKKINDGVWKFENNIEIVAKWNAIVYSITYNLDGGVAENPANYTIEQEIVLNDAVKTGYTFAGWTVNGNAISVIQSGTYGELVLNANFEINTYSVDLDVNGGNDLNTTNINITYGDTIELPIPTHDNYPFMGWYYDGKLVDDGAWTIDANVTLKAKWGFDIFEENGIMCLYMGRYPQTVVSDATIISELEKISNTNERGYYEFNGDEYAKITCKPYSESSVFSDGTVVINGVERYFKVEPIKWKIVYTEDGYSFLWSDAALDMRRYDDDSNNYELSEIRMWLNSYFYDVAFTDFEKLILREMIVDNSYASIDRNDVPQSFASNTTYDYVKLLSNEEFRTYNISTDSVAGSKEAHMLAKYYPKITDYTVALRLNILREQYAYVIWTRSPSTREDRTTTTSGSQIKQTRADVKNAWGVVPCIMLMDVINN